MARLRTRCLWLLALLAMLPLLHAPSHGHGGSSGPEAALSAPADHAAPPCAACVTGAGLQAPARAPLAMPEPGLVVSHAPAPGSPARPNGVAATCSAPRAPPV